MRRALVAVGIVVLGALVCVAGVRTDKIVFGDDTEMTTAGAGGSPPGTNTTTVQFSQGVYVDGDVAGYDTYIGKDEATDYALRTTDGTRTVGLSDGMSALTAQNGALYAHLCDSTYAATFQGGVYVMGAPAGFEVFMGVDEATDYALRATDGTLIARLAGNSVAAEFTDGTRTTYLCDGMYAANLNGAFYLSGDVPGTAVYMGVDDADDYALKAEQGDYKAWLGASTAAGNFSDGTRQVYVADGMYAISAGGSGSYFTSDVAGMEVYVAVNEATDYALRASDGVRSSKFCGDNAAGTFEDGTTVTKLGTGAEGVYCFDATYAANLVDAGNSAAGYFSDGTRTVKLAGGVHALNVTAGDLHAADDIVVDMTDAAGTGSSWQEWAIGGTQDQDSNWRMGVVNSNLVVQVRVSGSWTNATVFTRP